MLTSSLVYPNPKLQPIQLRRIQRRRRISRHQRCILQQRLILRSRLVKQRLQLVVLVERVPLQIRQQHLPRPQPSAVHNRFRIKIHQPRFRSGHNQIVFRHKETTGPQPIPVQRRPNQVPIRKRHRRRTIPRLDAVPVIRQKCRMPSAIRWRHHHPHRLRHRPPIPRQQLNHFVQAGRIRSARRENRPQFVRQRHRARRHPRPIAPDRVDLPVVAQNPERLRAIPRRRNIRRVPLMKQRKRRHKSLVRQIRIKLRQQLRIAHRLVNDGGRRNRTDVPIRAAPLKLLPRQIQPPVHLRLLRARGLSVSRICRITGSVEHAISPRYLRPRRHVAPTQHRKSLRENSLFQRFRRSSRSVRLCRQEHHPHRQRLLRSQRQSRRVQQQLARNRRVNPNAVARLAVRSHSAAVRQTRQRRQRFRQNVMARVGS